jgi:hypothetical protein
MTRRTICHLSRRANVAFRCKFFALLRLIRRRFPIHIKNLIQRPECLRGITVAIEAPLHQQGRRLEYERHLIDLAVTRRAAHAFVDVNAVIEIDKIGQSVHFHPLDGLIGAITFPHWFKVVCGAEKHRVAVHAGFRGRDSGNGGSLDARVTVSAVDAVVADVVFVAELHGLFSRNILVGGIRRSSNPKHARDCETGEKNGGKHTKPGDEIRAAVKNLGHFIAALWRKSSPEGTRCLSVHHCLTKQYKPGPS